jgi:hypothetical protein
LVRNTEKGSTAKAKNPVYVEWYGINYKISIENKQSFWKRKFGNSNPETGPTTKTIIENIHGCANPGRINANH